MYIYAKHNKTIHTQTHMAQKCIRHKHTPHTQHTHGTNTHTTDTHANNHPRPSPLPPLTHTQSPTPTYTSRECKTGNETFIFPLLLPACRVMERDKFSRASDFSVSSVGTRRHFETSFRWWISKAVIKFLSWEVLVSPWRLRASPWFKERVKQKKESVKKKKERVKKKKRMIIFSLKAWNEIRHAQWRLLT